MSWYNPVSWFVDKENLDAGNAAAEKLQTLNEEDYGPGGRIFNKIEAEDGTKAAQDAYFTMLDQDADQVMSYDEAVASVDDAFSQGWSEALDQRTKQSRDLIGGTLKTIWGTLPWWLWIALGSAAFIYLGGLPWLKRQLKA